MRISGRTDGQTREKILDFHNCTAEDLEQFAPPIIDSELLLNKIIDDPDRNLYCFDWEELKDEMVIYGVSSYTEF